MDVTVEHNGNDITQYLDNYTRQQKICTGIGTLEISFVRTIEVDFEPWDIIELYEEGIKKGTYYIDSVSDAIPDSLITLSCRDGCKKLMDYFISTSYFIDYPSYARTWIEQFLEEAQVNYEFNVSGNGNLLSNNTSLGNSSTYDQIIPLLQMNGWYIYFDADGKAVVGKLQTDLSSPATSVDKGDILNIKVSKNDKMLRNRVVVWGGTEEATGLLVAAEASTNTPWNYDEYDLRTSVISSSSIASNEDAMDIATMALSEFAQITVEKTLECVGAYHLAIGEFLSVSSDVFSGVGLITTIGSTLSKEGFKTIITLDERCPRLFAFFDFGDFVYVSTMGNGVWRKPIEDSPWYDYSVGLADLRVTDLYKNSGILSAVTASGVPYYNIEETGIWNPIDIQNLSTFMPNISGFIVEESIPFSGAITARAIIQDRNTNNVRIAAGSNDSSNYVDYATGKSILSSGVVPRSWVVDFNPNAAAIENVYPIHVGDAYNYDVLDIENDGAFDYVAVASSGWLVVKMDEGLFGMSEGHQWHPPEETRVSYTTMIEPLLDYNVLVGQSSFGNLFNTKATATYDDSVMRGVVGVSYNPTEQKQYIYGRFLNEDPREFEDEYEVLIPKELRVLGIHQTGSRQFTVFSKVTNLPNTFSFGTVRFNNDTFTTESSFSMSGTVIFGEFATGPEFPLLKTGHMIWGVRIETIGPSSRAYGLSVDMRTSSFVEVGILDCGGDAGSPNRLAHSAAISPLANGGVLIKLARCYMEVNFFSQVSRAEVSIVNFSGPDFIMYEQAKIPSTSVELNRWAQEHVGIGMLPVIKAITATANIGFAFAVTPFLTDAHFLRSVYPTSTDYDIQGTDRISNIVRNNYSTEIFSAVWQAGPNFTNTILGLSVPNGIFDFLTGNRLVSFDIPEGFVGNGSLLPHVDSINDSIYILAKTASDDAYLLEYKSDGGFERAILLSVSEDIPSLQGPIQNAENWLILSNNTETQILYLYLYNLSFAPIVQYSVLKRVEDEFVVLKTDFKNMRLDDSLGMPLVSVSDKLKTTSLMRNFTNSYTFTNILSEGDLEETIVNDFKYTNISTATMSGVIPGSGVSGRSFIYAADTGVNIIPMGDSLDLSENEPVFVPDAGIPYRLETTNYKFPNQRIFTTTSGESGNRFFQSDPVLSGFVEYTDGFPQTIVTRIRVDDRL